MLIYLNGCLKFFIGPLQLISATLLLRLLSCQKFSALQPESGAGEVKLPAQHLLQWQKQCASSKDDSRRSEFR